MDALPLFQHNHYEKLFRRRYLGPLLDFRFFGRAMRKQLLSLPSETITAADILVCPLTRARAMFGLALWLARTPREKHPFLAINFMIDDISHPSNKRKRRILNIKPEKFYRFAFSRLRKRLAPDRLLLSAGGIAFAQAMTRILNHPVQAFPLPVQHEIPFARFDNPSPEQSPLIVFLGSMRKNKGSDLAGAVIRRVLQHHPCCRFYLQANPVCWEERWGDEIGPVGMTRVHIHRGEMAQEEYQNTMNRADLVLIPYLPAGYTLQTSGVFSEAMAMGKVSIIPEGTWMADMFLKFGGGGVLYPRHEVGAIVEAILKGLEHLPQLTRDMQGISSMWQESMGMKAFLQRILDAAGSRA
ncbi:glycosyltransferase [Desulfosarcina sp.]|uniref:glycosyltransferase n=1 Tax=Desulfosarcina sp. TaxID=2027861 RepID=UPI0029C0C2FD|nr:glycosyltransferase [Desulfosarcina sp.]